MAQTLIKVSVKIKNDAGTYTNGNVKAACSNDNILKFANAYSSLQNSPADMITKKEEFMITL
ncbi:MAG: hypothetical protein LBS21_05265 [Clostridiales bacterium]|jgi:hypothetical protein|nr:hypothetical protein [Clostridiales bacterium]